MRYRFTYLFVPLVVALLFGSCYKEQHFDMPGPYGDKEIIPDTFPFPFDSTRQAGIWLVKDGVPDFTRTIFKGYTDFRPEFGDTLIWNQEDGRYTSRQCWNYFALDISDHFGGEEGGTVESYRYSTFITKPFVKYFPGSKWYFYAKMSIPYFAGTAPYFWVGGKGGYNRRNVIGIDGGAGFNGNPVFFLNINGNLVNSDDWPIMTEVMTPDDPAEIEIICVDYFLYFKIDGRVICYYNLPQDVHSFPIMYNPWRNAVSIYDVYMEGDIEEVCDFVCYESEKNYITVQAPALVRADNGDILLFGEGRVAEYELTDNAEYAQRRTNATDIVMKRSTDDGATWSELQTIVGKRDEVNIYPTALTDKNGDIHLLYTLDKSGYLDGSEYDIYQIVSKDNGNSWSSPVKVTTSLQGEYGQSTVSGHGIRLEHGDHNDRLAVLTTCVQEDSTTLAVMYSDDNGDTWQSGTPINIKNATGGTLTELSDGRLLVTISHNESNNKTKVAYSSDGGETFTDPEAGTLSTGAKGSRVAGTTLTEEGGRVLHFTPSDQITTFNNSNYENMLIGNPPFGRGLGVTASEDNGVNWTPFESIWTKETYDTYYILCKKMDAIMLNDGRVMCIAESGVKCPKEGLVRFYY